MSGAVNGGRPGGGAWFHRVIYRLLWLPVRLFAVLRFRYTPPPIPKVQGPCLVVCNHNTDYDLLMVSAAFHRHMYFVGSEHIYRWGLVSKLLWFFFAPIARMKGATDGACAMGILRALRNGRNVCLFAEGNRSFTGLTTPVHPTVGKLAKLSKANLVIYRLEGAYFTSPRWSMTLRRGAIRGVLARIYTPAELKAMTQEQINDAVTRGIREDAYALQDRRHLAYRGRRLAEGLETALYLCPQCQGIQTLQGQGDTLRCRSCGFRVRYTEYGYLEGTDVPFRTVTQWDAWQTGALRERTARCGRDETLFADAGETLRRVGADHTVTVAATGTLTVTPAALRVGDWVMPLERIESMGMYGRQNMVFTADGENYELKNDHLRSGRKLLRVWELARGQSVGV